jgi:hypothetical protein
MNKTLHISPNMYEMPPDVYGKSILVKSTQDILRTLITESPVCIPAIIR